MRNRGDRRETIFRDDGQQQPRWAEPAVGERMEGGAQKVRIAALLRQETLATSPLNAERLQMGSAADASALLYR